MKYIKWFLFFITLSLLSYFSFRNSKLIEINVLTYPINISPTYMVLLVFVLGTFLSLLVSLSYFLQLKLENRALKKDVKLKKQEIINLHRISVKGINHGQSSYFFIYSFTSCIIFWVVYWATV